MSKTESLKINNPKIGIVGLGPVGMILAVHLQEAGCEVAIYDHNKIKKVSISSVTNFHTFLFA